MYTSKALARQAWKLRLDEATDLRHLMAKASDFNKQTLDHCLANTLEAVVGAVFIDKKQSLVDTIPFLEALGLTISEKNLPKLYGQTILPFVYLGPFLILTRRM
jgi:dsRNA-specific ribonuclease